MESGRWVGGSVVGGSVVGGFNKTHDKQRCKISCGKTTKRCCKKEKWRKKQNFQSWVDAAKCEPTVESWNCRQFRTQCKICIPKIENFFLLLRIIFIHKSLHC